EIAADQRARLLIDSLECVDSERQVVTTRAGAEIGYGALLLTIGARRTEALPGALTFRGSADSGALSALLARLESGSLDRLAFVVPPAVRWPLALYELALLSAAHLATRRVGGVELT